MGDIEPQSPEQENWYDSFKRISHQVTVMDIFECDGRYYFGNNISAVKEFIKTGYPDNCFSDWLQKNWSQLFNTPANGG